MVTVLILNYTESILEHFIQHTFNVLHYHCMYQVLHMYATIITAHNYYHSTILISVEHPTICTSTSELQFLHL